MAGAKKKKKPAANPARGFATTSVASKTRPETTEDAENVPQSASKPDSARDGAAVSESPGGQMVSDASVSLKNKAGQGNDLSAEEFEKQLEEAELQLLVEKHAQKARRDANRQRSRLETDRRLLRSQAETINTRKWLPQELMDHILDLIQAENRFASSSVSSEHASNGKMLPEEDMIIRLWTLQQTLAAAGFPDERVQAVTRHILDISPNIPSWVKDSIWGLEEAMDWLARECPSEELPEYENRRQPSSKQSGIVSAQRRILQLANHAYRDSRG